VPALHQHVGGDDEPPSRRGLQDRGVVADADVDAEVDAGPCLALPAEPRGEPADQPELTERPQVGRAR
jgi:hypothetical protein